jgi:hypothetical protein
MSALDILHSEGSDSIVLCDPETHDDIAEVFHCDRHTVNQTAEQAMATARMFAAAARLHTALIAAKQEMWMMCRTSWNMADFKNFAVVQQIDAALTLADGKPRQ